MKSNTCSYCGDDYCPDHRLPEQHNCVDFSSYNPSNEEESTLGSVYSPPQSESVRENVSNVSLRELAKRTREKREQIETRQDRIEKEQKEQFGSPDVNLDGSLSEPAYEDDIRSIGGESEAETEGTKRINMTVVMLALVLLAGVGLLVYTVYF